MAAQFDLYRTPEAVLVFSGEGLGGMSRTFHSLWERHLLPPRWVHAHRPVLLNSWEAAYFDFDEDKLVGIAASAAKASFSSKSSRSSSCDSMESSSSRERAFLARRPR